MFQFWSSSSRMLVRLEVICNNLKLSDKYIYCPKIVTAQKWPSTDLSNNVFSLQASKYYLFENLKSTHQSISHHHTIQHYHWHTNVTTRISLYPTHLVFEKICLGFSNNLFSNQPSLHQLYSYLFIEVQNCNKNWEKDTNAQLNQRIVVRWKGIRRGRRGWRC